jgi:glycolate oxidase iron-sulfur subunit
MQTAGDMRSAASGGILAHLHLKDCVHCGLCLTSCPTYLTSWIEMASPRGRISMVRALGAGESTLSPQIVKHLDQCLGCLGCQAACPSGVPYGRALDEAREVIEARAPRGLAERLFRGLLAGVFPYPDRLGPLLRLLYPIQRLGIVAWVARHPWVRRWAPSLAQMTELLPPIPPPATWAAPPARSVGLTWGRGRAGLMLGCAQRFLLPEVNRASTRVLTRAGFEVVVPPEQGCCGALHLHLADAEEARRLAKQMIATFEAAGVDVVVANAAGCGAAMKDYGRLLEGDPDWGKRAAAFSARVKDITELLATASWNGDLLPVPRSVTYHDACHLAHAQGVRAQPRGLLSQIPSLRLVELPESDLCCGSAGVFNLLQPVVAERILERKIERIKETGAAFVAAGNIGCLLQLQLGLRNANLPTRAVHPVEILDWALHGEPGERKRG